MEISGVAINHDEMSVLVGNETLPAAGVVVATDERVVITMPPGPKEGGEVSIKIKQPVGAGT